jgi:hypothetical protein
MIKSESMRWERGVVYIGETLNAFRIFIVNSEGLLRERSRQVWGNNIKIDLKEIL